MPIFCKGYDPLTKAITDFVEITTSGTNSIVKVDIDGAGTAYGFQQLATLQNITGLTDEAALKASGHLIAVLQALERGRSFGM